MLNINRTECRTYIIEYSVFQSLSILSVKALKPPSVSSVDSGLLSYAFFLNDVASKEHRFWVSEPHFNKRYKEMAVVNICLIYRFLISCQESTTKKCAI